MWSKTLGRRDEALLLLSCYEIWFQTDARYAPDGYDSFEIDHVLLGPARITQAVVEILSL